MSNTSTEYRAKKEAFNKLQLDLLTFFLERINPTDPGFEKITIDIKDFKRITGRKFKHYEVVRDAARALRNKEIIIEGNKYGSWFSFVVGDKFESQLTVTIDPEIKKYLLDLNGNYVKFQMETIFNFKKLYSKRIYPYLKSLYQQNKRSKRFTISELKELAHIPEGTYDRNSHFIQMLKQVEKDFANNADMLISCTPSKGKTRSYEYITIEFHAQNN